MKARKVKHNNKTVVFVGIRKCNFVSGSGALKAGKAKHNKQVHMVEALVTVAIGVSEVQST